MILPVAIVGCGNWGPKLLRNFSASPRFSVEAVIDIDPARRAFTKSAYPTLKVSPELREALAPGIALVVIATPPEIHFELGMKALEAGKHLLMEKPMAMDIRQCRELNALAARKGLRILVDHTMVFHPAVEFMRNSLAAGELGNVVRLEASRINASLPRDPGVGTDVVWDLAPHDFSIADYLFGMGPETVSAIGSGSPEPDGGNSAEVTFTYPGGMTGRFRFTRGAGERVRRTEIRGSLRRILFDDGEAVEKIRVFAEGSAAAHVPALPPEGPLGKLVEHVWDALARGAPTHIGGDDGERIVGLVEAVQASLGGRGRPVAVG